MTEDADKTQDEAPMGLTHSPPIDEVHKKSELKDQGNSKTKQKNTKITLTITNKLNHKKEMGEKNNIIEERKITPSRNYKTK